MIRKAAENHIHHTGHEAPTVGKLWCNYATGSMARAFSPPHARPLCYSARKCKMTEAWKTMVADAVHKPPAKRTPIEIESIRVALQLTWLGQRLKRIMDQENEDEITEEQFHDALVEILDELLH